MFQRLVGSRVVACVVTATAWVATSPFIGEWKLNPSKSMLIDQMKVERVAGNKYALDLGAGMTETIAVDGTDQPGLAGTTLSVTVEGPGVWKVVRKKDGRTLLTAGWTLSKDGKTLTDDYTEFGPNGPAAPIKFVYKRTEGRSGFDGTWQNTSGTLSPAYVLKVTPYDIDGLSFIYPAAEITKNVRFDGKDYPKVGKNAPPGSMASARRVSNDTLEITDKIDGKATDTQQLTISSDLKTLTITVHRVGQRDPNILVFERQ
jgi:hypothetical protein